jgi:hypothetical protein
MTTFNRPIACVLIVAAPTIAAALVHGRLTNRWENGTTIEQHAARIKTIPAQVGEWRQVMDLRPLDQPVQRELGVRAHINRVYENDTGKRITVLVMVGQPGPLVRHPIEICYGNRAKRLISTNLLTFGHEADRHNFKVQRYEPKSVTEDEFYVAYGFCRDGTWDVPASPRMAYGGARVLYKMQVLTHAESISPDQVPEHLSEFVQQFSISVWNRLSGVGDNGVAP